jgi:hypothetical protein
VLRTVAWALTALLVILTVTRAARSWPRDAHLGYAEGIWLGLAVDASHGVLYRPIEGPNGIGGSRYFPLYYVTIAAGIALGLSPIVAGYLTTAISVALLFSGIYVLARRLGVSQALAAAVSALALACQPAQMALLGTRGDALACGLAIWGLASCVTSASGWSAPLLFALAFATKPTSIYAPVAVVASLLLNGRAAEARGIVLKFAAIAAAVVGVFIVASGGRMLSVLAASSGGGASFSTLLAAPISAAHILRRVPESAMFIATAGLLIVGLAAESRRWRLPIHQTAWVACGFVTLAIYASPATIENHLIDLTSLSLVVFAVAMAGAGQYRTASLLPVAGVLVGVLALSRSQTEDRVDNRAQRAEVLASLADVKSPILFDQPMLAVQRGEAPYVLDQYVTAIRYARDPAAVESLARDIEAKKFGAIVFENLAVNLSIDDAFPNAAGKRFKTALERGYRLDRTVAGRPIYRPR